MRAQCLIVPGVNGSDPAHWQSWLQSRRQNSAFVSGIDYGDPVIARWADQIRCEIIASRSPTIVVAHSFGCLATALALQENQPNVIGVVLVAPASPEFFTHSGPVQSNPTNLRTKHPEGESVFSCMPRETLGVPGILVGSSNDPWMKMLEARFWADCWGLQFILMNEAGHINTESGFGKWTGLLTMIDRLEEATSWPLGDIFREQPDRNTRSRNLIEARRKTRIHIY